MGVWHCLLATDEVVFDVVLLGDVVLHERARDVDDLPAARRSHHSGRTGGAGVHALSQRGSPAVAQAAQTIRSSRDRRAPIEPRPEVAEMHAPAPLSAVSAPLHALSIPLSAPSAPFSVLSVPLKRHPYPPIRLSVTLLRSPQAGGMVPGHGNRARTACTAQGACP